ncbi:MAG: hypothetical protein H0V19_04805 [Euzebyales bacterium]|nr:hypothetical protein [Euzebyales bacterium]
MFDRPGIGVEDLAWIHRDQFVYYVQLAHALGDPTDWSGLRHDLLRALTAAFGLDAAMGGWAHAATASRAACPRRDPPSARPRGRLADLLRGPLEPTS